MNDLFRIQQHQLFDGLEKKFHEGDNPASIIEALDNYENDNRLCLTTIVFPPKKIQKAVTKKIIKPLHDADPKQYFYAPEALHTTILTIRKFADKKSYGNKELSIIVKIFKKVLKNHSPINYSFQELFELPTSLGVRGYSSQNLVPLVSEFRNELKNAGLPDDRKLASDEIFFGHITACRFTTPPNQKFLKKVRELKNISIGKFTATEVYLIESKVNFSKKNTKVIGLHKLQN